MGQAEAGHHVCVCVWGGDVCARARANGTIHKRYLMMPEEYFATLTGKSSLLLLHCVAACIVH
jgi:hypothetical protein